MHKVKKKIQYTEESSRRSQPTREEADVGRSVSRLGATSGPGARSAAKRWRMFRGQTWSTEEVQTLISIWSDETMAQLLASTHKNREVFKLFSEKMAALGFHRSVEQCRIKVKKLRLQYFRVRDALGKGGGSPEEKEKFVWYDELDGILGSSPANRARQAVESFKEEAPWTPTSAEPTELFEYAGGRDAIKNGKWVFLGFI